MAALRRGEHVMRKAGAILVLVAAATLLAACGRSDEKTVATGNGSTVTQKTEADGSQSVVAKDAQGNTVTVGTGAGATAKTPDYAPIYPGATIETSVNANGANDGGMVMFKTNGSADSVIAFYKQSTAAAGLASGLDMTTGDSRSFSAKDEKTNRVLAVVVTKSDGTTTVQMTWSNHG